MTSGMNNTAASSEPKQLSNSPTSLAGVELVSSQFVSADQKSDSHADKQRGMLLADPKNKLDTKLTELSNSITVDLKLSDTADKKSISLIVEHIFRESIDALYWSVQAESNKNKDIITIVHYKNSLFEAMRHMAQKSVRFNEKLPKDKVFNPTQLIHVQDSNDIKKEGDVQLRRFVSNNKKKSVVNLSGARIYIPICTGGSEGLQGHDLKKVIDAYANRKEVSEIVVYLGRYDEDHDLKSPIAIEGEQKRQKWLVDNKQYIPKDDRIKLITRQELINTDEFKKVAEVAETMLSIDDKHILDSISKATKKLWARKQNQNKAKYKEITGAVITPKPVRVASIAVNEQELSASASLNSKSQPVAIPHSSRKERRSPSSSSNDDSSSLESIDSSTPPSYSPLLYGRTRIKKIKSAPTSSASSPATKNSLINNQLVQDEKTNSAPISLSSSPTTQNEVTPMLKAKRNGSVTMLSPTTDSDASYAVDPITAAFLSNLAFQAAMAPNAQVCANVAATVAAMSQQRRSPQGSSPSQSSQGSTPSQSLQVSTPPQPSQILASPAPIRLPGSTATVGLFLPSVKATNGKPSPVAELPSTMARPASAGIPQKK